jgi:hypothetical protein
MRSVIDIGQFPSGDAKFNSGKGDFTFTIWHDSMMFVVDATGSVVLPAGATLVYCHSDKMQGNQSSYVATVRDFLTVDPSMDSPGSKVW